MSTLMPLGTRVPDWWDIYMFDDPPTITCPDCDETSFELEHLRAAVEWCEKHDCPA